MVKKKYSYPAGILNKRMNWEWQGIVVAFSLVQAKKLLQKFKKSNFDEPHEFSIAVMVEGKTLTTKPIGVWVF